MTALIFFILSLSIGIPFLYGITKIGKCEVIDRLFIVYLGFGFVTELVFYFLSSNHLRIAFYNIYVLLELIFLLLQFYLWGILKNKWKIQILLITGLSIWIISNFIFCEITLRNSVFPLFSSLIIVILSIDLISKLYNEDHNSLLKNHQFIIASCFIIFFSLNITVESFFVLKIKASMKLFGYIFSIKAVINVLINLLFVYAIAWMPTKKISI